MVMTIRAMTCTLMSVGALLVGTMYAAAAEQGTDKSAAAPLVAPQGATAMPELPEGHPQLPKLPTGHPPLDAGDGEHATAIGTLTILVGQGTKGGPALTGDAVVVEFYVKNKPAKRFELKLDSQGKAVLEDLHITTPFQPMVTVHHAGATFGAVGQAMSPHNPDQVVRVTVFELTDERPDFYIAMRHVVLKFTEYGVRVNEVLSIASPGDRAWRGRADKAPSTAAATKDSKEQSIASLVDKQTNAAKGKFTTFVAPLPPGAIHVQFGKGFHPSGTKLESGQIRHTMPLPPGESTFQYAYVIPAKDGQAVLQIAAPVAVKQTMVIVPADGPAVTAQGVGPAQSFDMGKGPMLVYRAADLKAGATMKFVVDYSNAPQSAPATAPAKQSSQLETEPTSLRSAQMIAGVGVAGVVLCGAAMMIIKLRKAAAQTK
jgi:hypothetical protein